jgi:pimeloyl-ACP methyl ester carboxylesterase
MRLLLILFVLLSVTTCAQQPTDWGAFMQSFPAKGWAGKKFKLEAAVKTELIDPTAHARLWVRVDKDNNKMGFFDNMDNRLIRSPEWQTYTITGKIDANARSIVFGGIYTRKGIFHFDNFRFYIETTKGQFEEMPVPNGDFETDTLANWFYMRKPGFTVIPITTTAQHGKQSLQVDGSMFKKANSFGNNDSTGKYVTVNGIKIYYEEYGAGEPLLLLHGNRESIGSFKLQIPEFQKHYRVIAVDTRGQGQSGEDGKTYTYDLFAEDMNALLDHLKIDSTHIVGWSDGGNTGLIMAIKYPRKVKKLVTMGAVVFINNTVVDKSIFKAVNQQIKDFQKDTTARGRNSLRLAQLLLNEPKHSFSALNVITCPTLVMAGEKDIVKEGHTKGIAAAIPGSTLLIVPKATHEYPWDDPVGFNKAVLDFLKKR